MTSTTGVGRGRYVSMPSTTSWLTSMKRPKMVGDAIGAAGGANCLGERSSRPSGLPVERGLQRDLGNGRQRLRHGAADLRRFGGFQKRRLVEPGAAAAGG